ncbi:MAG: GtrA family protein [Candidatus Pacebacteria bacterium]|nr:GtrA family protein [Candidatus Paceibacterota bacterium]MCF7856958.1 GtrA family protein [Candidatus Paceibacterota bacterium]
MYQLTKKIFGIRIFRFLFSGGTSASIHIGIVFILTDVFDVWYRYATTFGFLGAVTFNFIMQKFFTFRNTDTQTVHKQSLLFFLVASMNFFVNYVLMIFFVERVGLAPVVAQIVVAMIIAVWSYLAYSKLFKNKENNLPKYSSE